MEVFVGFFHGKEEAENRAVGSCYGKREVEDRLWQIGGSVV